MSPLPFWKVESVGNDFVLVHLSDIEMRRQLAGSGIDETTALSQLAQTVCERRFSVGSDGLLAVGPHDGGLRLRMFNPDGTEDFCGNGLRCAAWHARELGWTTGETTILHRARSVRADIDDDGMVVTDIGKATFEPTRIPVSSAGEIWHARMAVAGHDVDLSCVSTGSTHTVLSVDTLPEDAVFLAVSRELEVHPMFPERTSVIWMEAHDTHRVRIRIWERGAGETLGCGTGSSAAAVVHARTHDLNGTFWVENRGGIVTVQMDSWQDSLTLASMVDDVYSGTLEFSDEHHRVAVGTEEAIPQSVQ
ncbi:MAG: Diaminopimelate epimerase [Fimbriimonadaceae bacterium]|nr:Diaminopimelate epimerase [Fimbriimonadaceae bacterium]